jgi:hypothetical protein
MHADTRWSLTIASLVLALAACAKSPPPETGAAPENAATQPTTMLRVTNQNFYDMNVFLVHSGQRSRLGLATGNGLTSTFQFPSQWVVNGTVRIVASPVGAQGREFTEPLQVRPGDVVEVTIQP